MKKNIVKITKTKSKIGRLKFGFELTFDQRDPRASEEAFTKMAGILAEVLETEEERQRFLAELQGAIKKAVGR
ncbi:MAG: hypothetical protein ACRD3Y_04585 [Bryobacteraceae bacterium]